MNKLVKFYKEEPISITALGFSLFAFTYDHYRPTTIPTGSLSVVNDGLSAGLSLGLLAIIVAFVALVYLVVKK